MSPKPKSYDNDDMLPEYDFRGAVRGKYYERYREGTNVVLLDPDVAEVFRDASAVNEALRLLVRVATAKTTQRRNAGARKRHKRPRRASGQRRTGQQRHAGAAP